MKTSLRKLAYAQFASQIPDDEFNRLLELYAPPTSKETSEEKMQQKARATTAKNVLLSLAKLGSDDQYRPGDRMPYNALSAQKEIDDRRGIQMSFERVDGNTRGEASDSPEPSRVNASLTGDA